jgi:flagellar hook assembly protein FlgD
MPNPATGSTVTLQVTLASGASLVRIEIFTLSFRKIDEIDLTNASAGIKDVAYNLTDRKGSPLANGLYYVIVVDSNGRAIGKLLVMR